jgi:FkbM family methyltransferase
MQAFCGALGHFPPCKTRADRLRRRALLYAFSDNAGYYSQFGQDQFVDQCIFRGRRDGTFVDIGAHDGVSGSNSYYFEMKRGWTGLCIEANPETYPILISNRKCICVQGCAAVSDGSARFLAVCGAADKLSGRLETFPLGHVDRIHQALRADGGHESVIDVPCYEINALLREHQIVSVDFLSLDTEGGEYDLLRAIALEEFNVRAVTVENNYTDRRIEDFMRHKGYRLLACMGCDEIYAKPEAGK